MSSHSQPRLADVKCSPVRFQPGDRVIVRTAHALDAETRRKLHQTVSRWAGPDVEVLIVELPKFDVAIDRGGSSLVLP